jgi:hypothetical protein
MLLHTFSSAHKLIKTTVGDLLEYPIRNWEYNRPPDHIRCNEISSYLAKPEVQLLQPFYIHYDSKENMYYVLDGIHRYTALTSVEYKELVNPKIVFIHIFTDMSKGMLVDIFENLNKTIPVPELYVNVDKHDSNQISVIEEIISYYQKRYKEHFSPKSSFCSPNINRESFTNLLTDLYKLHNITSKKGLEDILSKTNNSIKERIESGMHTRTLPNKFSDKQKDKCRKSGLYLFLYNCEIIKTIT